MELRIPEVTLLKELGRGPGGVVFQGLHRGNTCTVKFPSDRPPWSAASTTHFEQDVLLLARLRRAGLPRVLQLGATGDTPYAIFDTPEGRPLARVLEHGLAAHDVAKIMVTLASCLQQLHQVGFVHGSLTAHNILLSPDGGWANLLDKGSVRRPVPFDPRVDTRALGQILRQCVDQLTRPTEPSPLLGRIADGLLSGVSSDLSSVIDELQMHVDPTSKRRSSYPPPNREWMTASNAGTASPRARNELSQLRRVWEQAAQHGGKIVEVLGPAGSGKSRLLGAFAEQIGEQNVQVLSVKCRDNDWAPFSALKRLLDGHLAGLSLLEPSRRTLLEDSLRLAAGPMASRIRLLSSQLAILFADATSAIAEGDAQQVFVAGMADFLAKYLESSGSSVLIIDDIHWLDASSRMVLSRLAARLCPQGHLLVCGARDDADCREPLERFRNTLVPEFVESIQLGPLNESDARGVIAEYLGLDNEAQDELVQQLSQLSDGTPLSLLELLRLTIERGHLRPHAGRWHLDAVAVQRMRLPGSSQALIERRLSSLDPTTLDVLRAAAVIRSRIDPELLAQVTEMDIGSVQSSLDRSLAARLLEIDAQGAPCFVHDCVWEALLLNLSEPTQRALHQHVADALAVQGGHGAEYEYEFARHHTAGTIEQNPRRAFDAILKAARRALEACDDALALSFLKPAEVAAQLGGIDPDREFYVQLAETSLRTGATIQSRKYFEHALQRSAPGFERARVRGRIAWIHHFESNASACWQTLDDALNECSSSVPRNDAIALLSVASRWAVHALGSSPHDLSHEDAETLCGLYCDYARVSFDSGRPVRGVYGVLQAALIARQLKPCRALVHANLLMAFVLAVTGRDKQWRLRYARAEAIAYQIADPIAQTLCHQLGHVIAGWLGDLDESTREARVCTDERGHWMELGELCHVCFSMYGIETVRGRPEAALAWTARAIERVRQTGRAPAMFALIEDAARSTLLALGRDAQAADLDRQLRFVERAQIQSEGYFHTLSYQSRVQRFTERGELDEDFEYLVEEFNQLRQDPKQVHILVVIYYLHVAHARVHQCLRVDATGLAALLPKLDRAVRDVERATRVDATASHAWVTRAAHQWLSGSQTSAERLLVQAERSAREHGVAWVSYAAARLRAHMLRTRGKHEAARDQARIAAFIAQEHHQYGRLRFIREEFDLGESATLPERNEVDSPYTRRHLDALLHISQANSRELSPERQARFILDELLETVQAERALLFMRDDTSGVLTVRAGRRAGGEDVPLDSAYQRALVDQVYATGQMRLATPADVRESDQRSNHACIVVALVLREQAVGVLYLDRPDSQGSFRPEDVALLQALANQVPLALELASTLRERDRLQQNLKQAHKMEAIGRLAGGIAHDFNNILTAIQISAHGLVATMMPGSEGQEELDDILASARRGAELTRQLLTLSRGQTILPRRIILGEVVQELMPMLHRLVRQDVRIELDIDPRPLPTLADPSGIERVLMNLCQNASDAMPDSGGTITIRVGLWSTTELASSRGTLRTSENYALLSVADDASGMSEEVRARLFEPFFTTKSGQRGTGLGLANVYAIVQQCSGHIEVMSELGVGSTFRIYLPRCQAADESVLAAEDEDLSGATILFVSREREPWCSEVVRRFEIAGYLVLIAEDCESALTVVDDYNGLVDLAVAEIGAGLDTFKLADQLVARDPDVKLLFIADESDDLQRRRVTGRNGKLVADWPTPDELFAQVQTLLQTPPTTGDRDPEPWS